MAAELNRGEIAYQLLFDNLGKYGPTNATLFSVRRLLEQLYEGAGNMVNQGARTPDDLKRANRAVERFLDEMDAARRDFGYSEFREDTVDAVVARLCPGFWPFC